MSGPFDGEMVREKSVAGATLLLYDWFKHMTTLSLVTLGGVLGILQAAEMNVRSGLLGAMISAIAVAGILGFDGQNRLLIAEIAGKPLPSYLTWHRRIAMAAYGTGTGAFLSLIVESVS
ncbi:hypothetical protein A6F68_01892 [Tsuneonella dongtanensis]|uniref:Uncharacterized protein n=1 Tax=Tsuneonella dongtanensis TaxID=692370 RepID=A0A1B2AE14_9SPHN|nr:hypothetical protein [Tsuneonella dongtanensis]ANY20402.1 hypothetical protein A6F68_01892 [Tsuneonella dongtanensis]